MSTTASGWTAAAIKRAVCWKSKVSCMTGDVRMGSKTYEGPGGIYVVISSKSDTYKLWVYSVHRFDPDSVRLECCGSENMFVLLKNAACKAKSLAKGL